MYTDMHIIISMYSQPVSVTAISTWNNYMYIVNSLHLATESYTSINSIPIVAQAMGYGAKVPPRL